MALVNCPECGRENVSDTALSCPSCGFNLREYYERSRGLSPSTPTTPSVTERYAGQLRKLSPENFSGTVKLGLFNQSGEHLGQAAVSLFPKNAEGNLLVLGYGKGGILEAAIRRTRCQIYGADLSQENYRRASKWNLTYIRGGRLHLQVSSLEDLVCNVSAFSHILTVNTCYFWPKLHQGFSKLHAMMEPGGSLICGLSSVKQAARCLDESPAFDHEALIQAAQEAGFQLVETKKNLAGTLFHFRTANPTC